MADVFIAVTQPEIIPEEWPPKAQQPQSNDAAANFFAPTYEPVANSQGAVIHSGPTPESPGVPVMNVERSFAPAPAPITNDGHAAIFSRPAGVERPVTQPAQSPDVQLTGGVGAPISNERGAGTIHYNAPPTPPEAHAAVATEPQPIASTPVISNERNVSFVPSPAPPTAIIPGMPGTPPPESVRHVGQPSPIPMNVSGDTFIAPAAGVVQGGGGYNPDAQILQQPGAVLNVDSDRSIGGGGDPTRLAGSDSVSFGGIGAPIDLGGTDVVKAASGDTTRAAGGDDVTMTPNADALGNQETFAGAQGDPIANKDFNDYVPGAVGKPLKRNVT